MRFLRPWLLALALLAASGAAAADPAPAIAAASDLKFVLDELAAVYRRETGRSVRIAYGSSGNFFRQIAQDAPFELFLSADESFVFQLAERKLSADRGVLYAVGRIVLFVRAGSALPAEGGLDALGRALRDGRLGKLAIAHPEHAPYGRAAMQALQSAGLWEAVQGRLVLGENVSQAAQFVASGSAQAGVVAYSLAKAPAFSSAGRFALIPEHLHQPLRQRMVLTAKAGAAARAFYDYLQQPSARRIFRQHGFTLPGEATP